MNARTKSLLIVALFGYFFAIVLGWEVREMLETDPPEEETIGQGNVPLRIYTEKGIETLAKYLGKCARLAEYESDGGTASAPPAET